MTGSAAAAPIIMIEGELVALGPLRRDLAPLYARWFNDLSTLRTLGQPPIPRTIESEEHWFDRASTTEHQTHFTIYERAGLDPIGSTELQNIDPRNRRAEFGITIGETKARGRGLGTETTCLMLDYAFTCLGLHNVMLTAAEYNLAGLRAYEKAGFQVVGRRRRAHMMGGKLWDIIHMDCLASDFNSPVLSRILAPDEQRRS